MAIILNGNSRIMVQGISGRSGSWHANRMQAYMGNVVGGTSPGHGGEWSVESKIPIFDSVLECVRSTDANTSVVFVPAYAAGDAIIEAIHAGIQNIIAVSAGIPLHDMLLIRTLAREHRCRLIGPNSAGILNPGLALAGVIPHELASAGSTAVISKAGSLLFEVLSILRDGKCGISTAISLGEDPIHGLSLPECLELLEEDPHTEEIVLIDDSSGISDEGTLNFISTKSTKKMLVFPVGGSLDKLSPSWNPSFYDLPITSNAETIKTWEAAGIRIVSDPRELSALLTH